MAIVKWPFPRPYHYMTEEEAVTAWGGPTATGGRSGI